MPVISEKGQVTIPKKYRDKFGIKPGDKIEFRVKDDELTIEKEGVSFKDYEGFLGEKNTDEHMKRLRDR